VHQARLSQLSRALADAKAQYPPDSPEVKTAEAAVAATTQTVGQVSSVHQQLNTPDPAVAAGGWALHGRVFDSTWKPVSAFTVFLVDPQKAFQQDLGFSYTDDTGYFLINYPGPQSTSRKAASASAQLPQLFIEIADTNAEPVYLSDTAFQPVTGGATYQNIVLPAGNRPIGDPPKEIRDIALPKQQRRKSPPDARHK
jgi:hypothetical protein